MSDHHELYVRVTVAAAMVESSYIFTGLSSATYTVSNLPSHRHLRHLQHHSGTFCNIRPRFPLVVVQQQHCESSTARTMCTTYADYFNCGHIAAERTQKCRSPNTCLPTYKEGTTLPRSCGATICNTPPSSDRVRR